MKPVHFHHRVKQGSQEWHDLRANRITASVAAACVGMSRWASPQKAYRQILGLEETATNWYMEHGRKMEPLAVSHYEYETGLTCEESGFWIHETTPWLGASPDRLVGDDGCLEVKTSLNDHFGLDLEWRIQAIVQLHCTGREWCDVVWFREVLEKKWRVYPGEMPDLIGKLERFYDTFIRPRRQPLRGEVQAWA